MNTPTPRTDALAIIASLSRNQYLDFAEQLERELTAVTEQRDRLAEACEMLMKVVGEPNSLIDDCWASEDEIDEAWNIGNKALQSLTTIEP